MLSINTNLGAFIVQSSLNVSTNGLNQAIERMSTGFKINHAKDNAANYSIITGMNTKISAYQVAEDNALMGLDLISTAEGSLEQIQNKLQRLRALQEQANNGTYGGDSLMAINSEANALIDEIERLYSTTEYNGQKLFSNNNIPSDFVKPITRRDTSGMTKFSTVDSTRNLASGTYSIDSEADLQKLVKMVENEKLFDETSETARGTYEFVLSKDLNLKDLKETASYGTFTGILDGNGYTVKSYVTLFGGAHSADIKNLKVNSYEEGDNVMGALVAVAINTNISNFYVTADIINYENLVSGGLV